MEFRFGAGDRGPPGSTWFPHPLDGYTGAQGTQGPFPPPPPPLEWQSAPRELIIREAVTRRLTEEWAKADPAFARGLNGGFGPDPFFAPDRFMPLPHAPPPVPFEEFGAWQGFGPRRRAGLGGRPPFLCEEWRGSPPRPDPKHKLKLLEVEPSGRPEALSPKVPMMKRKSDANAATTVPKKVQKLAEDWSCALCQVSAPSEAGLNEHLGGREHKAKLAQCGISKAIKDDKNCLQTTTGNEKSTDPCDAPKKICMLVDGATCEAGLNEHLGGRKHKAMLAQCGVSKAIKDDKNCLQTTTGNENSTDACDAPKKICMLVDGATCEAGLNEHLGGRKHKAKLALCGASKAIEDAKNSLHATTGNKNSTDPCDAPKKIVLLVDGEMHEVVRKNNHLWCDRCRVRCYSNVVMAGHLRSKKHSKLNKALSPKVPMMKRKADANAATTVAKKVQKLAEDWSRALCQVSAPSEAGLNGHLGGRKLKAKLAQCGVSKAIKDDKNCLQTTTGNEKSTDPCYAPKKICMLVDRAPSEAGLNEHLGGKKHTAKLAQCGVSKAIKDDKNCSQATTGNKNSTDPSDAPKKICILVDGEMHEVVRKNKYLWCDRCRVSCGNNATMACHLRSKMHNITNVWTSIKAARKNKNPVRKEITRMATIKAVRTNTETKEGLPSSCGSQALSPKVPMMERKADANAATTVAKKVQKLAKDWSCALCQVSALSEAGLNNHLGGRKHKAKLAQCGVSKAIKDDKNCLQMTTGNEKSTDPCDAPKKICMLVDGATCEAGLNEHLGGRKHKAKLALCGASKAIEDAKNSLHATTGNKNSTDPCDAPKKIFLLVDGEMHEVVQKNNYLWCDRCRVSCHSNVIMAGHLRSKKHSKLNKVWTSIKAVRTNTDTKEGLPSCGSQVNTNGSTEIPAVIEGDINMTTEVDESGTVENPVQKEITRMATIWAMFSS